MYQNVNTYDDFYNAFVRMGRQDQFSLEALDALLEYYEEYEDSTGEQIELDVIAICCDWTEYNSLEELLETYSLASIEDIRDNHTVIEMSNGHYLVWG